MITLRGRGKLAKAILMTIFEIELDGWCTDPAVWPKDRSLKTFRKFFHVYYCSSVVDLGDGPIDREYI